jgi:hypothetical protein
LEVTVVESRRLIEETGSAPRDQRLGWDEAFRQMAEHGDDAPLFPDEFEDSFDATEWEW